MKSKRAAIEAANAASAVRREIQLLETVVDFTAAISALEEIKRLHRQKNAWAVLPDRYALIRKTLIQLRVSETPMTEEQKITVQNALADLSDIEAQVEKYIDEPGTLRPAKFNKLISSDIDGLHAVLAELKYGRNGGRP